MRCWVAAATIIPVLLASCALADPCGAQHTADRYEQLENGYRALYDLDFDRGETLFLAWSVREPQNPLGPVSQASGYLFQEFERLGVLRPELLSDDQAFEARSKLSADPKLKARFQQQLSVADRLADETLAHNPYSVDALLAKALVNGLQADYAGLIEKRNVASLSYAVQGRRWAERLLRTDASCYDAYVALGAENYLLSAKPLVMRWIARLAGGNTDREKGLQQLRLAAQNGRFLKPFAKLLLAIAALRDHDRDTALGLLSELQREFPRNPLYTRELSRLKSEPSPPKVKEGN